MLVMRTYLLQVEPEVFSNRSVEVLLFPINILNVLSLDGEGVKVVAASHLDTKPANCSLGLLLLVSWLLVVSWHVESSVYRGCVFLDALSRLYFGFLRLEDTLGLQPVYLAIDFAHERDRDVWQEVQDIDCCPAALSVKESRVGPAVGRGRLQ